VTLARLSPCREWPGQRSAKGYGLILGDGRPRYAHREALEEKLGRPIAPGMQSCHTCDNPPCTNPDHLFEGTNADNQRDSADKGRNGRWTHPERTARGERCHTAKLTADQVLEIRARYRPGRQSSTNIVRLASAFGVAKSSISRVVRGATWTHVGVPQ
jgi:hypothetical protein